MPALFRVPDRPLIVPQGGALSVGFRVLRNGVTFLDSTWFAKAQIRTGRAPDAELIHTFAMGAGASIDVTGAVVLYAPAEVTAGWSFEEAFYDVKVSQDAAFAGGTTRHVVRGRVTLERQATW